jgi:hypothetical protein
MANSKKTFIETAKTGLNTLIPARTQNVSEEEITEQDLRNAAKQWKQEGGAGKVGRPRRADKDNRKASAAERGTKPGEMRQTYLVSIEQATDLKNIAYRERKKVKECLHEALKAYIDNYYKSDRRSNGK